MAISFYTAEEAQAKLGLDQDGIANLVRAGKLREFRDAGRRHYTVDEVDAIVANRMDASSAASQPESSDAGTSDPAAGSGGYTGA